MQQIGGKNNRTAKTSTNPKNAKLSSSAGGNFVSTTAVAIPVEWWVGLIEDIADHEAKGVQGTKYVSGTEANVSRPQNRTDMPQTKDQLAGGQDIPTELGCR